MIAVAIMAVAMASILSIQSSAIRSTRNAKKLSIVSMLAKNTMVETELLFEGLTFKEVPKTKEGKFKEPYTQYSWKREIKEIEFPNLNFGSGGGDENASQSTQQVEKMSKIITNFLSKAIREVNVTVSVPEGKGTQNYSVSTYWVDLNHEFKLSEF